MAVIKKSQKAVANVAAFLKRGGVVICPTDTVYGFLANAANKKAVARIYKLKKRAKKKLLPVFVKDFTTAKSLAKINGDQEKIIKKYWPGKYTFILNLKKGTKLYGTDKNTIALRMPQYPFLNAVLKKINTPLSQTSVNISNKPSLSKISDIIEQFGSKDILIIDGGDISKNKSSQILDLTRKSVKVVRK